MVLTLLFKSLCWFLIFIRVKPRLLIRLGSHFNLLWAISWISGSTSFSTSGPLHILFPPLPGMFFPDIFVVLSFRVVIPGDLRPPYSLFPSLTLCFSLITTWHHIYLAAPSTRTWTQWGQAFLSKTLENSLACGRCTGHMRWMNKWLNKWMNWLTNSHSSSEREVMHFFKMRKWIT